MKITVDAIVRNAVALSTKKKTEIARDLEISRTWLDKILSENEIDVKFIQGIGKSIGVDFSLSFPELQDMAPVEMFDTSLDLSAAVTDVELKLRLIDVQAKYIKLLEAHVKLLGEHLERKG